MPRLPRSQTARRQPVALYRKLRDALRGDAAVPRGSTLVVACSGGPDSLALLLGLAELAPRHGIRLVVAHLDHGLRPDSEKDARSVVRRARALALPCFTERIDASRLLRQRKLSGENGLRILRREFLQRVCRQASADFVALGHTADDQAETVLLRLARGTGVRGLAAMRIRSGRALRPLLRVTRDEVVAFLRIRRVRARQDASNRDLRHARNRVRRAILPELRRLNPRAGEALASTAKRMAEIDALLRRLGRRGYAKAVAEPGAERSSGVAPAPKGDGVWLVRSRLLGYHPAVRESVLLHAWRQLQQDGPHLTRRHLRAVHDLLERGVGRSIAHLPGRHVARLDRGLLFLGPGVTLPPDPDRGPAPRPTREPQNERRRR